MYKNTLTHLTDPKSGRNLYLIGSTHASTQLALRTQKLIQDVKPDSVYLQTNQDWADKASKIENCFSQQDMDKYNFVLKEAMDYSGVSMSVRSIPFYLRFYPWLAYLNLIMGNPFP